MSIGTPIIARTWDQLPPVVQADGEWFSTRVLAKQHSDQQAEIERLKEKVEAWERLWSKTEKASTK